MATISVTILERPIARIKETCEMMGLAEKFDRALPDLETYLEGEVAAGETSETRLTYDGLVYLSKAWRNARSERDFCGTMRSITDWCGHAFARSVPCN